MAETTAIEWCDHTFNCWWGCVNLSPACDNCYAETLAARFGTGWGKDARRKFFGDKHWSEPFKWDRKAEKEGVRRKVFCGSMMDIMERLQPDHPDHLQMATERTRLWSLIEATPHLDWLLLTKRPANFRVLLPRDWVNEGCPPNVWLMTTVEGPEYVSRIHELLRVPADIYGLSMEPLFGFVDLPKMFLALGKRGWVITGGESGPHARPGHPDWYRHLRDQAVGANVPFFFKQWGCWLPRDQVSDDLQDSLAWGNVLGKEFKYHEWEDGTKSIRLDKHIAGRTLDGRTWDEFPGREQVG